MRILVTGSSGLVGSALVPLLTTGGHEVTRLVRRPPGSGEVAWDPSAGRVDPKVLEGFDAVVHLAGENIAEGRWNDAKKARIRRSRVHPTRLLAEGLSRHERRPAALICASAVGFYGDRGEEILGEDAGRGAGFLSDVCSEWEAAASPAAEAGIRVAHLRFGVILSAAGGALRKMLAPFKMGLGGRIGDGRQYMSWISIDDAAGAILHALRVPAVEGPVNAVAPEPVTNARYTRALGRVLSRPTIFPVPAFAARLAFGEMADALLLASTRAVPRRLSETGYDFRHADLDTALRHLLGRG